MTYSDKLRSPKWQKRRLEILSIGNFTCSTCFEKDEQLQVHHKKYISGREPWEYPDELLIVLCANCHNEVTTSKKRVKEWVDDHFNYSNGLDALYDVLKAMETGDTVSFLILKDLIEENSKKLCL